MQQSELVFAYGSNMDPQQMRERCPESDLAWFIAEAKGWRLVFPRYGTNRKCAVGGLARSQGTSVWGVVFAVSNRDLVRLDRFEGVRSGAYKRKEIIVVDQQGRTFRVWTYFARPDKPPTTALPSKDYISLYIRGAEYFGLPEAYVKSLKGIKTED